MAANMWRVIANKGSGFIPGVFYDNEHYVFRQVLANIGHNAAAAGIELTENTVISSDHFCRFGLQGRATKTGLDFSGYLASRTGEMVDMLSG